MMTYDKTGADIREAVEKRLAAKKAGVNTHQDGWDTVPPEVAEWDAQIAAALENAKDGEYVEVPRPDWKDSNPKQAFADKKIPLDIVPKTAIVMAALAHLDGACKYGKWNWRMEGVRASTYLGAAQRHLAAWENGEENAPDGVPHLGHALACINIIIDAKVAGKLNDDRPPSIPYSEWMDQLTKDWVPAIKARNADKTPYHYTIKDSVE